MGKITKAFFSGRMLCVFALGISSGLPLLLIGSTLKAWMKEAHVDLTLIGLYSLTGLPYTLKFLWSPLMDRFVPPFLGRRRGWILICQLGLAAGFVGMASLDPLQATWQMATVAFAIAFLSASQDIAIDAYRREILNDEELGLGSSMAVNGYRVGMLLAGAFALILADHINWHQVYHVMAGLMILSTLITFLSREPEIGTATPKSLREAALQPFMEYFRRRGAWEVLFFILIFKIGDSMASDMFNPFFLDLGFTKTQIGEIAKFFGFWATIGGGLLGGMLMVRLGIRGALWTFGFLQMLSTFGFSLLAQMGNQLSSLTAVIVTENVCTGMATSAYIAFMASLCNKRFTATQYALLTSLTAIPRAILGSSSGFLAKHLGWEHYFLFCTLLHLPGLVMLLRYRAWTETREKAPARLQVAAEKAA